MDEICCPICLEAIREAFMTICGHSYCYVCIARHLSTSPMCPTCKTPLRRDQLFPNYTLNAVLEKVKTNSIGATLSPLAQLEQLLSAQSLALSDVNHLLGLLLTQKRAMESQKKHEELELLLDFLYRTKQRHNSCQLNGSYDLLEGHIKRLERQRTAFLAAQAADPYGGVFPPVLLPAKCDRGLSAVPPPVVGGKRSHAALSAPSVSTSSSSSQDSMNLMGRQLRLLGDAEGEGEGQDDDLLLVSKKRRIGEHIEELQQTYFGLLKKAKHHHHHHHHNQAQEGSDEARPGAVATAAEHWDDAATATASVEDDALDLESFGRQLQKLVRFNGYETIATIHDVARASPPAAAATSARLQDARGRRPMPSLVTSLEFDKEGQHFAVAGYNQRIRVFDYRAVVENASTTTTHFPVHDLTTQSRLSCVSWNGYIRSQLASSEYSGRVSVWDLNTSHVVCKWHEHEKRVWSVHFAPTHPTRLASASDDAKVKLWSMNQRLSTGTIEAPANVCSVKFHPDSLHHLAFGAADHQIYYYDARAMREPLFVLRGHDKAVSHIQFLDSQRLVSASIDGTLRLWDINTGECLLSFASHVNKRLFVGLSVHGGEWVTTGSEDNQLYTYHRDFKTPLFRYSFDRSSDVPSDPAREDDFVSAVCYHPTDNVVLAANSRGLLQAIQLK